jgi:hypothetical protein
LLFAVCCLLFAVCEECTRKSKQSRIELRRLERVLVVLNRENVALAGGQTVGMHTNATLGAQRLQLVHQIRAALARNATEALATVDAPLAAGELHAELQAGGRAC